MKNNSLIKYKIPFLKRIINFIKSRFGSHESNIIIENSDEFKDKKICFDERIKADNSTIQETELLNLKLLYDKQKVEDESLDISSIYKLIELYNNETEELKKDTKRRISNIKE